LGQDYNANAKRKARARKASCVTPKEPKESYVKPYALKRRRIGRLQERHRKIKGGPHELPSPCLHPVSTLTTPFLPPSKNTQGKSTGGLFKEDLGVKIKGATGSTIFVLKENQAQASWSFTRKKGGGTHLIIPHE
jgi:hypothetical protein